MKKIGIIALCISLILSGCGSMNNTTKKGLIGGGAGAALGAIIGGIAGKGKGAVIGAAIGTAVGGTAGALIGKKMDKAAAQAAAIEGAEVEQVTDSNGLQAVKVTFANNILFATGKSTLGNDAQASLSQFANDVLRKNPDMDVEIQGYTDNQGWKGSTVAQSQQKNLTLSQQRAQSVASYLLGCGVGNNQIKNVVGYGEANPVADNSTKAGQEQNRRVEIYMYASTQMIQSAEAGTLN